MLKKLLDVKGKLGKKIAVLGAAGGVGQPLSLLLKNSPYVKDLFLFDIIGTPGVAADLSHINTNTKVSAFVGLEQLECAVGDAEIVLITAGVPRKPGMTREDLFKTNARIVGELINIIALAAPKAFIGVVSNPVNSIVPVAAGILKKAGVYNPLRLFGITTLDVVRANTFVAEMKCLDPENVNVPVIGGHSAVTMVPLLSQCTPRVSLNAHEVVALTKRIQEAGSEVVNAKAGAGSATLSMAFSAARFTESLCRALQSEENIIECAFVESTLTEVPFFALPVRLGCNGIQEIKDDKFDFSVLSEYEKSLLVFAMKQLKVDIEMGENFLKQY